MRSRKLTNRYATVLLLMMAFASHAATGGSGLKAVSNNLKFDGTLVADPCVLDTQPTDITLDFGTVIDTYLYLNTLTLSQPFIIRLLDCYLTRGNQVEMTLKGNVIGEPSALAGRTIRRGVFQVLVVFELNYP